MSPTLATEVAFLEEPGNYSLRSDEVGQIRLSPRAMAGAEIEHMVEGPAKLVGINQVGRWMPGSEGPAMGEDGREFVIEPTGTGTIIVTLDVTFPGANQPEEQQYVIRIR